jgi:hypothetical protein
MTTAILAPVLAELERATAKFPTWPTDPLHAVCVLGEEFGELQKAVLQHTYEPHKSNRNDVREEAIQTAAMALRFLLSIDNYEFDRCPQHSQTDTACKEPDAELAETPSSDVLDLMHALKASLAPKKKQAKG